MEFTSLLNTSLDLTIRPLKFLEDAPPPPPPPKQEAETDFIGLRSIKEERGALIEELNRVNAENKKLTELLTVICENYNELRNQWMKEHTTTRNPNANTTRKRKGESNIGPSDCSSSDEPREEEEEEEEHIKDKVSRVSVRTEASDTSLIVKDGYQWRKYGQKVTRDNPCPRAYFKCSFAPTCPVKKKVQRSIEDQSILVATYEGEHNHPHPDTTPTGSSRNVTLGSSVPCSSGPTITLDLTKPKPSEEETKSSRCKADAPDLQQYFVEQMATTLTQDPNFKAALAAAISGKFLQQNNQTEKW